jgi:hypothetical protein
VSGPTWCGMFAPLLPDGSISEEHVSSTLREARKFAKQIGALEVEHLHTGKRTPVSALKGGKP